MNAPVRLGLYGLSLIGVFVAAALVAGAVVPDSVVAERVETASGAHAGMASGAESSPTRGVSLESHGFQLSTVRAPGAIGVSGELSFEILDSHGEVVTEYTESHEKDLHLIVVRTDGAEFTHVHPELGPGGSWTMPWTWQSAGSYRIFADLIPAGEEEAITLTRTVEVAGELSPASLRRESLNTHVDGYDVRLEGELHVGATSVLTLSVTKNGDPVTTIEPYLGAFGHLVALRDGDLAYLHVHPEGAEPAPGDISGPDVEFATAAPTAGLYLLYFDFQIEGEVRSAPFIIRAAEGEAVTAGDSH